MFRRALSLPTRSLTAVPRRAFASAAPEIGQAPASSGMSSPNRWIIGATIVSAVALACFSMKSKTDDRSSLGYSPYTPRALTLESLITAQAAAEDRDPTAELKALHSIFAPYQPLDDIIAAKAAAASKAALPAGPVSEAMKIFAGDLSNLAISIDQLATVPAALATALVHIFAGPTANRLAKPEYSAESLLAAKEITALFANSPDRAALLKQIAADAEVPALSGNKAAASAAPVIPVALGTAGESVWLMAGGRVFLKNLYQFLNSGYYSVRPEDGADPKVVREAILAKSKGEPVPAAGDGRVFVAWSGFPFENTSEVLALTGLLSGNFVLGVSKDAAEHLLSHAVFPADSKLSLAEKLAQMYGDYVVIVADSKVPTVVMPEIEIKKPEPKPAAAATAAAPVPAEKKADDLDDLHIVITEAEDETANKPAAGIDTEEVLFVVDDPSTNTHEAAVLTIPAERK
ncbi:hypothetical protein H696_04016 [Fonticula alba]|uniref:Uncharacterized protein n=1 Tax=Fonticula alba TaxID=691883 RepID=A0A058Z655_FONAL|nr:hypothetical protein H696_04016 [Fonticula alba]KCV69596.1 hypothetical protein H696_04016 [Fonticula alba]|eukprot:XP_009496161.1 hypothetical protein H696_04016 [Fonticula alba]